MGKSTYIAIDLKSFYASVECVERKLDPLTTNLVVADASRTDVNTFPYARPSFTFWRCTAHDMQTRHVTCPTEISIPPVIMTSVIPQDKTKSEAFSLRILKNI